MKIGILGSGEVGQVIGAGFADRGYEVMLGTRDPHQEKVRNWLEKTGGRISTGTFAETAEFCDVAVLATLWTGT